RRGGRAGEAAVAALCVVLGGTSDPGADRRSSGLRCPVLPWRPRGIVVERLHRVLLAGDGERGQFLLGLEPVLHVASLRAAGVLPQLAGAVRDAPPQLVVVHVGVSPSDGLPGRPQEISRPGSW